MRKENRIRRIDISEFEKIEEDFFEIDKEKHLAKVRLSFDKVSDILDCNYLTGTPVFGNGFIELIENAFNVIPFRYKVELDIAFADFEGYSGEELSEIFKKNIVLYAKSKGNYRRKRKHIAYGLIAAGVIFFIGMLLTELRWQSDSFFRTIVSYISDIATTVTFWEAMTILIVEKREERSNLIDIERRFAGVFFKETPERS